MKLEIDENSSNYAATIVEIQNIFDIAGADKIKRTNVLGNDVVVGLDTKVGDKYIYFCSGTKLSPEYCRFNNLLTDKEQNRDKTVSGYISHKQFRVKAIKLKSVISDGILMPISSLVDFHNRSEAIKDKDGGIVGVNFMVGLGIKESDFKVGDTFTTINGFKLCEKYIVPSARNSNPGGKAPKDKAPKLKELLVEKQLRFHKNTEHFSRNLNKLQAGDSLVVTRKYHGSSKISSHVLVKKSLKWYEKLLLKLGVNIPTTEYGYIYSSGKPKSELPKGVISDSNPDWFSPTKSYYSENIWLKAFNKLKNHLEKGITLYGEIVGEGVQGADFTYGFEHEVFIYRITQTNVDGVVYEFSWQQVKDYCDKYGINYVHHYETVVLHNDFSADDTDELLEDLSQKYLEKSYPDCKTDEGVCIRNERTNEIFKLKSKKFILVESNNQDQGVVDIETSEN